MASNQTKFRVGNTAGKKGRPKGSSSYSKEEREARKVNREMIFRYLNQHLMSPVSELKAEIQKEDIPVIEAIIIKLLLTTYENPTVARIDFLLDRTIGKVKQLVRVGTGNELNDLSDLELRGLHKKLKKLTQQNLKYLEKSN